MYHNNSRKKLRMFSMNSITHSQFLFVSFWLLSELFDDVGVAVAQDLEIIVIVVKS